MFAVRGWVFRAAPNDPAHTSSEETAASELVPAVSSPLYVWVAMRTKTPGERSLAQSSGL